MPGLRMLVCVLTTLLLATGADAIAILQVDDFQDATTQSWGTGSLANPNPPQNVPNVGPAGAGDHSLRITGVGGFGAGSNLVAMNPVPFTGPSQWTGNYSAAGVAMIFMSVRNPSASAITLRLGIGAGNSLLSDGMFATTAGIPIPALSGWPNVSIPLLAANLTFSFSNTPGTPIVNPAVALTDVTQLRILHSTAVNFRGEPIAAQLLVDNVVAVPEPGLPLQLGCAFGSLWVARAMRKRRSA
jgi:hypothetical protein